jgi:hypothetical protein
MDLKRRLSVKAQLPLKKKQNSRTFPLTWDQKNNNRVGINNKFVLNSFKLPAGVGNRYLSGLGSLINRLDRWLTICEMGIRHTLESLKRTGKDITIVALLYQCLWTYGFAVFFLKFLSDVWWPTEVDPLATVEILRLKTDLGGCNETIGLLNNPPATLLPPTPEDSEPPANSHLNVLLAGLYFINCAFSTGICVYLLTEILKP